MLNVLWNEIFYGPLPILKGQTLYRLDGGSTSAPADGALAPFSFTDALKFPPKQEWKTAMFFDVEDDMFRLPKEEYKDALMHVFMRVEPSWIRVEPQIPPGVPHMRFREDRIVVGADKPFGFVRGSLEMIYLPGMDVGYVFANDTNATVKTRVKFNVGMYRVEVVKDEEFVSKVLEKQVHAYWFKLPLYSDTIRDILHSVYGFEGFQVPEA